MGPNPLPLSHSSPINGAEKECVYRAPRGGGKGTRVREKEKKTVQPADDVKLDVCKKWETQYKASTYESMMPMVLWTDMPNSPV